MISNRYAHFAPVILRIAVGLVFIVHGLPKLMNPARVAPFFGKIGIPMPGVSVLLVGAVELIGGLLLLVGFGTRVAAALLAAVMLVAILTAKRGAPFVGGWEYDFVLLAATISLVLSGPVGQRTSGDRVR